MHGPAHHVLWIGDFNARTGNLADPNSPDIVVNPRGRALVNCMRDWNYQMACLAPGSEDVRWTYRHMEG